MSIFDCVHGSLSQISQDDSCARRWPVMCLFHSVCICSSVCRRRKLCPPYYSESQALNAWSESKMLRNQSGSEFLNKYEFHDDAIHRSIITRRTFVRPLMNYLNTTSHYCTDLDYELVFVAPFVRCAPTSSCPAFLLCCSSANDLVVSSWVGLSCDHDWITRGSAKIRQSINHSIRYARRPHAVAQRFRVCFSDPDVTYSLYSSTRHLRVLLDYLI